MHSGLGAGLRDPPEARQGRWDLSLLHLNQLIENAVDLATAANVTTTVHRC